MGQTMRVGNLKAVVLPSYAAIPAAVYRRSLSRYLAAKLEQSWIAVYTLPSARYVTAFFH